MKVFNDTTKERIALSYDLFQRDEFLDRLFKFLDNAEDLILKFERRNEIIESLLDDVIEGYKTQIIKGAGDDYPIIDLKK